MITTRPQHSHPHARVGRTRLRVRYADTDRMGVVYYANYFVWFEVGRTEWLRDTGWTYRDMEHSGIALPVIEAGCQYRLPARYDDEIEVATRATLVSHVRIRFDYKVNRLEPSPGSPAQATLLAAGHTVHAATDATGKPSRLPASIVELLQ